MYKVAQTTSESILVQDFSTMGTMVLQVREPTGPIFVSDIFVPNQAIMETLMLAEQAPSPATASEESDGVPPL
jgi:hypothetical protein